LTTPLTQLTERQSEILAFIKQFADSNGFPPTRAQIAAALGFASVNAAVDHLKALERKGALELLPHASRGIVLKEPARKPGLPVVGRVAAGSPILAEQHIQARYQIDPNLFKPRADYLLRVRGLSMRDAGILDGDLLAVHRTSEARSGQIVVARINDEVTVKRLKRQGAALWLLPENSDFEPIAVDGRRDQLVIEGLGVGVIRAGRSL
jgi:repressor LexA